MMGTNLKRLVLVKVNRSEAALTGQPASGVIIQAVRKGIQEVEWSPYRRGQIGVRMSIRGEQQMEMEKERELTDWQSKIKNEYDNEMTVEFDSRSQNESFARIVVASFATQLNPTLEELADIKTAVSEAVTNSIIHGYGSELGKIHLHCYIKGRELGIEIEDRGIGIENVLKAMEPMYTTRPEIERSGMGFAFMEAFMDELEVHSEMNHGTIVRMKKIINPT